MKAVTIFQPSLPTIKNIIALQFSTRILPDRIVYIVAVEADVKLSNNIFVSDFFFFLLEELRECKEQ